MARTNKTGAEGQLPRKDTDTTAELGIAHDHGDGDKTHIHRLGNVLHDHDTDGRPVFPDDRPRNPATGKFIAKRDGGWFNPASSDGLRLEIEAMADLAVATMDDQAWMVDLAARTFDFEAAALEDTMERFAAEVDTRGRYLVFAAAAQAAGHHPVGAYCFAADRNDPGVAS